MAAFLAVPAVTAAAQSTGARMRALLRSLWWWSKGVGVKNPPMPAQVRSVLFVCLGNICRSPFAAVLMARRLNESGRIDIACDSAGLRATPSARPPDEACASATAYGLSLDAHTPQALTRELMDAADVVIVMELRQRVHVRECYPAHRDRVFLLSLFDERAIESYERMNITDPYGRPKEKFDAAYSRIDRAVARLIEALPAQPRAAGSQ